MSGQPFTLTPVLSRGLRAVLALSPLWHNKCSPGAVSASHLEIAISPSLRFLVLRNDIYMARPWWQRVSLVLGSLSVDRAQHTYLEFVVAPPLPIQ